MLSTIRNAVIASVVIAFHGSVAPAMYNSTWLSKTEYRCLVDNIYHEARGESLRGQILVARTTLTRAVNRSICDVVYEYAQFSWTLNPKKITDMQAWQTAAYAANLSKSYHISPMFFHTKAIKPYWAKNKTIIATEGNHIFYR